MSDLAISILKPEEQKYTYSQSRQIIGQTGCIGHLRADIGSGKEFYSTWDDHYSEFKTPEFKQELDEVINALRFGPTDAFCGMVLSDRKLLSEFCFANPSASFGNDREWGIRVDTKAYSYLMRLNPNKGEYSLYCYCYRRDWLTQHMKQAERGIRFITPHYKEIFRLKDGDQIRIITEAGEKHDRTARYIDDYHVEIGGGFGCDLYHICEFAERMEHLGHKVIPLRSSLPEKCYVYVESTDKIGLVERGEMGYRTMAFIPDGASSKKDGVALLNEMKGITKAQAAAMNAGSLFGWETKAADPANYNEQGELLGPQHMDRGEAR